MILDDVRREMTLYRQSSDAEAMSLKDPYIVIEKLSALYRRLSDSERLMADEVLGEWVLSEDEGLRFDAMALIDEMNIKSTAPALRKLATYLSHCGAPSAPYELNKISRIIARLMRDS